MQRIEAKQIGALIGKGSKIVVAPGCGTPTTLLCAIRDHANELRGSTLYSGLLLGEYSFIAAVEAGIINYKTWHIMPPIRKLLKQGKVGFYPLRASQIPGLIEHLQPDVALIRVSPPNAAGKCNLGPSVSYSPAAINTAKCVIAEIDENLPCISGDGEISTDEIDAFIESQAPTPTYPRTHADEISRTVANNIIGILPKSPTLQIGIGAIPEALVEILGELGIGDLRFAGMATEGMADLYDKGLLSVDGPAILAAELMGGERLMRFAHDNPAVEMRDARKAINPIYLSQIERFVSINSSIEVDFTGQVNSEVVGGSQISGVGGSFDFVEAALHSPGGVRILAMTAKNARDQSDKIVPHLAAGTPVTLPRHSVDYVVTEHGVARLGFATVDERIKALSRIMVPAGCEEELQCTA
ncbi:MAG: hypothetical protein APF78_01820 [Sphingomonadales bacterium BRH_c3]|nr:MAG: hypothetical protein APF78_01820 [Sphingomonadales bacterium BRH_c3]